MGNPYTGDAREFLLQRFQDVLKTVAPGVVFTFPDGMTHSPLQNDLGGRVYSLMRANAKVDATECPFVEIVTNPKSVDKITVGDDDLYHATISVQLWAYARATDGGDGLDSTVRPALNSLCADLLIAMEAAPYWTGSVSAPFESLIAGFGPRLSVTFTTRWTETATESAKGMAVLEFEVRYPFNKRFP
jgi:hypothetical protein